MANSVSAPEISLDEVSRLIRMLGMLGSSSDHEALVAARFVVRWIAEKHTDWETLLIPEEPGVSGVAVALSDDDVQQREEAAYQQGYREGFKAMAAQAKQQAGLAAMGNLAAQGLHPAHGTAGQASAAAQQATWTGLGGLSAAPGAFGGIWPQPAAQGPVAPSGAAQGPSGAGVGGPVYPQGTWQAVARELLDRHAAGIPGVLRTREEIFVGDILKRGFASLTQPQEAWLRDIARRNGLTW